MKKSKEQEDLYDILIIGGGPAGMTAGLFAARYNMRCCLVYSRLGGAMAEAHLIENYPGIEKISGIELAERMEKQVKKHGVEMIVDEVIGLKKEDNAFVAKLRSEKEIKSLALVLALGTQRRKLNIPGEEKFLGKGISYCATCDGFFFKNKTVAIVGGGDSALDAVLYLSNLAKNVYLIHRRDELRAEDLKVLEAKKKENVEFLLNKVVVEAKGSEKLEKIVIEDTKTGEKDEIEVDGLFIEIGSVPSTALIKPLNVDVDETGFIKVNDRMETNIEGVFACGDITTGSGGFRQIVTAVGEGAIAGHYSSIYVKRKKIKSGGS